MMLVRRDDAEAAVGIVQTDKPLHNELDNRSTQQPAATGEREIQFQQLIGILLRRRWSIIAISLLGAILAGVLGLLIPPKYTAKAQIVVEPQAVPSSAQATISQSLDELAIDTHITMLNSRDHLQKVLDILKHDPAFRTVSSDAATEPDPTASNAAADPSPPPQGIDSLADPAPAEGGGLTFGEIRRRVSLWIGAAKRTRRGSGLGLDDLDRGLKVNQELRSRVISVSFTSESPLRAAAVANQTVQLYVEDLTRQKREYATSELARLSQRGAELKSEMERAGTAVQRLIQQRPNIVAGTEGERDKADIRLRELERAAATDAQLYDKLMRRQKDIRDLQDAFAPDVRILSLAGPPNRPSSPNPILFVLPALIISTICASWLAVALDRLDRTLRSERDVNEALRIPCIGLVPQLPKTCGIRPHQYLLSEPTAAYTEAIRSLAASLQLVGPPGAPTVVLVTSSVPGEGKTTVAVSLAAYTAHLGRSVLLVDFDFEQPSISRELSRNPKTGVLDLFLRGGGPPGEVIQRIPELGLDYVPMQRRPVDAVALVAGERMPRLIHQFRENYDIVIIDGPSIMGNTEARLLAAMVDKVLFVVKWGSTRRSVAQNAIRLLHRADCDEPPSALVNQVCLKTHARFQYGDVAEFYANRKGQHA
jgi:succinoglycan biosynthesis transport protein ExoP